MTPKYSIVIPFYNERESLQELHVRLVAVLESLGPFEILYIDDGSTDGSFDIIRGLSERDQRVRALQFRRNLGKAAALSEAFSRIRGEVVVTIDADLQDEPNEIPKLIAKLDEGYDLVTGWKEDRNDPWTKTFPSRVFNGIARMLFGVRLHDLNCGLKVMRADVVRTIDVYGEFHRFIPILANLKGFRVAEVPVIHHERKFGTSKYGWKRFVRGSLDLVTVAFLGRFQHRPLHLFGTIGGLFMLGGIGAAIYLTVLHFQGQAIGQRPLLTFSVLAIVAGLQFFFTGFLAELIVSRQTQRHYPIRTILDHEPDEHA
jgi:glycosyltransferase involved in cell wall biosynthesis